MQAKFLRADDWWNSKAALLMGLVYLYAAWFGIGFNQMLLLTFLSVCTVSGFAASGYLCNDFFDIKKDTIAGKRNFLIGKPLWVVTLLLLSTLLTAFLPWLYLPLTRLSILLIVLQLLLLLAYSLPPIRLKERGFVGGVTDSLYAHTVPAALSLYTFSLAANYTPATLPVVCLLAWQFFTGIRNILIHQYDDRAKDEISGVDNFMAGKTESFFLKAVTFLIVTELFWVTMLMLYLAVVTSAFLSAIVVVVFFLLLVVIVFYNPGFAVLMQSRWRYFPNPVFEKWLPVIFLGVSAVNDWRFWLFAILHITLFNFAFYRQLYTYIWPLLKKMYWGAVYWLIYRVLVPFRILISRAVNITIYYLMRVVGVDLVKEQMSAFEYIKLKIRCK